jgi:hypothetical protein
MKQRGFFILLEVDNRNGGVRFVFNKYVIGFNLWYIGLHLTRCPFHWYVDFMQQREKI